MMKLLDKGLSFFDGPKLLAAYLICVGALPLVLLPHALDGVTRMTRIVLAAFVGCTFLIVVAHLSRYVVRNRHELRRNITEMDARIKKYNEEDH